MSRRRGTGPRPGEIALPFDLDDASGATDSTGHVAAKQVSTEGSIPAPAPADGDGSARPVRVGGWDPLAARSETAGSAGGDAVAVPEWVAVAVRAEFVAGWVAGCRAAAAAGPLPDEVARDLVVMIDGASRAVQAPDAA